MLNIIFLYTNLPDIWYNNHVKNFLKFKAVFVANIIYKSENIVPWDTQSAFKMTSYNVSSENNMVFCYLKAYVNGGDLVLCSYRFTEETGKSADMHIYTNLNPESDCGILHIDYGYDGISSATVNNSDIADKLVYSSFRADDEQGFYWCGEIRIPARFIKETFGVVLEENSIIQLNMIQTFENDDIAVLFGNCEEENYSPEENMAVFVVLNY